MMTLSRSCLPTSEPSYGTKMPLRQRELNETDNEADLSDRSIATLEAIPQICKLKNYLIQLAFANGLNKPLQFKIIFLSILRVSTNLDRKQDIES